MGRRRDGIPSFAVIAGRSRDREGGQEMDGSNPESGNCAHRTPGSRFARPVSDKMKVK